MATLLEWLLWQNRPAFDLIALCVERLRIQPAEVGRGDQFLAAGGERGEEGVAAVGIKFAEDVVEQQDRRLLAGFAQEGGLGEFEGEGDGALLAFRGELPGRPIVEQQLKIVAVESPFCRLEQSVAGPAFRQHGHDLRGIP